MYVDINGEKKLTPHSTLNQQIWFSTMALILGDYLNIRYLKENAKDFFENLPSLVDFLHEGLINQKISTFENDRLVLEKIYWNLPLINLKREKIAKKFMDNLVGKYSKRKLGKLFRDRSLGYMTFVLYGLALCYRYKNNLCFWKNKKLKKIIYSSINYIEDNYPYGFKENLYAWQYNPTGIEMAFVLETFCNYLNISDLEKKIHKWLSKQIQSHYDFEKGLMIKNTNDPAILASRLYEANRLKNYELNIKIGH